MTLFVYVLSKVTLLTLLLESKTDLGFRAMAFFQFTSLKSLSPKYTLSCCLSVTDNMCLLAGESEAGIDKL